ncbi:MAG: branched-chain amino acid aminotransferase [Desulfobacteraceae bacterium]|nr:MAG: branched-chain amino acid aminotransferase [Desulfobacteraceae bacterium]
MAVFYVDGEFLPAEKAVIPVDDLAVLRGIGVFDLLRTYSGRPMFLKEHVQRLIDSARQIDLDLPWSHAHICRTALETLSRNNFDEANIRIIVTGGSSPDFMTPQGNPRLLVLVTPLPKLPAEWYDKGVKVVTVRAERRMPGAKSLDYLAAAMALRQSKAQGAVEAVYVDRHDHALEGTTSNLFAVIDNRLITPGRGILSGITRQVVLDIAGGLMPIEIRDLPLTELRTAQEVFITGTNKGLMPVVQMDDTPIGDGRPGRFTLRIMEALQARFTRSLTLSD